MDGQLDIALVSMLEQKLEKSRFMRVDSDVIDRLIVKDNTDNQVLDQEKQDVLSLLFKSQLPKMEKSEFTVTAQGMGESALPVMITQGEYMRRMKEMSNIQAGMSFYGEMPDMYNLVLNADHKLVKEVLQNQEETCGNELTSVNSLLNTIDNERKELRKKQEGKKADEIPTAEKDQLEALDKQWDETNSKKSDLLATFAAKQPVVRQLIDLALLQNGMLKGEALTRFVKRSIDLIG